MNEWGGSVTELDSFVMYFRRNVPDKYVTHLVLGRKVVLVFDSVTLFQHMGEKIAPETKGNWGIDVNKVTCLDKLWFSNMQHGICFDIPN